MATDDRLDPFRVFNFVVDIDNTPVAGFSEVSGLTSEGETTEYREGNEPENHVRKLVGLRKYANLMLKRGYTQDKALWQWYANIMNGAADRRNVTIVLMNEARQPVMRWHAENAWINKIEGPAFKASSNDVAMESVELVHEGLTLET